MFILPNQRKIQRKEIHVANLGRDRQNAPSTVISSGSKGSTNTDPCSTLASPDKPYGVSRSLPGASCLLSVAPRGSRLRGMYASSPDPQRWLGPVHTHTTAPLTGVKLSDSSLRLALWPADLLQRQPTTPCLWKRPEQVLSGFPRLLNNVFSYFPNYLGLIPNPKTMLHALPSNHWWLVDGKQIVFGLERVFCPRVLGDLLW